VKHFEEEVLSFNDCSLFLLERGTRRDGVPSNRPGRSIHLIKRKKGFVGRKREKYQRSRNKETSKKDESSIFQIKLLLL